MSERDIALIDELRTTENELVEFKKDNADPKLIAKLCSALSVISLDRQWEKADF